MKYTGKEKEDGIEEVQICCHSQY